MLCRRVRCSVITIILWLLASVYLVYICINLDGELTTANILIGHMELKVQELNEKIETMTSNYKSNIDRLNKELENEQWKRKNENCGKPLLQNEKIRRRISRNILEIWYTILGNVNKMEKVIPEKEKKNQKVFLENFKELYQLTESDFETFVSHNKQKIDNQNILSNQLSTIIQKRLNKIQNPTNCNTARKLVCSLDKNCGFGCKMHHLLYCFIVAYSTKRTMVVDSSKLQYSKKGLYAFFKPLSSNCTFNITVEGLPTWDKDHERHHVVFMSIISYNRYRTSQLPQAVPNELINRILLFHGQPFVWWIGQFSKYVFNYQPSLKRYIERKKNLIGFKKPIVGVQIRRTDKISEAAYHTVEEYMFWVDLYYKKLSLKQEVKEKRVFLATDDVEVLSEIRSKYPDYIFVSDDGASSYAFHQNLRYTENSLYGVISDIDLLSETDYLVCTFSSQVCRLAYELMNGKHTDASDRFHSLDDIYYFGGQQEHNVRSLLSNTAKKQSDISFEAGDLIKIAGNHWNGEGKGYHHKSRKTGLFPAFKVEDVHVKAAFPHYDD